MTVHHAGALSVEYFESYLNLLMNARGLSLDEAKSQMKTDFFKGNPLLYGESTHANFLLAVDKILTGK